MFDAKALLQIKKKKFKIEVFPGRIELEEKEIRCI